MAMNWLAAWRDARTAWRGFRDFDRLPRMARRIVFYAESPADWAHLAPVVEALEAGGERVLKAVSDPADPTLGHPDAFYIGSGGARTALFRTIEAEAFVMTLPDLGTYHLLRSVRSTHYFYIFHSIASLHRVYREHAFDAYDTLLCVGPHHVSEMREIERIYQLPPKRLVEHGYGRLDTLLRDISAGGNIQADPRGDPHALIAPSWGRNSIADRCLQPLIASMLAGGFRVSLRLHPMTRRQEPELVERIVRCFGGETRFRMDPHIEATQSLVEADIMISDWSGAPLEYAFARESPVIFVDTPPKTMNPNFQRIGLPRVEAELRDKIGRTIPQDSLGEAPSVARGLLDDAKAWGQRIRAAREATVFNIGRSAEAGAQAILDTLEELKGSGSP